MVTAQVWILVNVVWLGVGGVRPIRKAKIDYAPVTSGIGGGRIDVPPVIVTDNAWVFDGDQIMSLIGDRFDQDIRGFPFEWREPKVRRQPAAPRWQDAKGSVCSFWISSSDSLFG